MNIKMYAVYNIKTGLYYHGKRSWKKKIKLFDFHKLKCSLVHQRDTIISYSNFLNFIRQDNSLDWKIEIYEIPPNPTEVIDGKPFMDGDI